MKNNLRGKSGAPAFGAIAAVTAVAVIAAGCSASSGRKSRSVDVDYEEAIADEALLETTAAYDYSTSGVFAMTDDYSDAKYDYEEYETADYTAETAVDSSASSGSGESERALDPEQGRLLIRTITMSVQTKDFDAVTTLVTREVGANGGYIENSSVTGTGNKDDLRYAYYTVRVPADKVDALIAQVGESAVVVSTSESTDDVTRDSVDTEARLESLMVEQEQLLEMLGEASDLDTILILQNELTEVRYQIESCESSLRIMENRVTYATLNLDIEEVLEEEEPEEAKVETYSDRIRETFEDSIENIKDFFKEAFLVLVAVSPVLVPIIVIVIIVIAVVKRCVRKKKAKAAADKAAEVGAGSESGSQESAADSDKSSKKEPED